MPGVAQDGEQTLQEPHGAKVIQLAAHTGSALRSRPPHGVGHPANPPEHRQ